jgi:hypothetical protein
MIPLGFENFFFPNLQNQSFDRLAFGGKFEGKRKGGGFSSSNMKISFDVGVKKKLPFCF